MRVLIFNFQYIFFDFLMLFVAPVFFLFIVNAQVDELQKALFVFFTEIHHLGDKITEMRHTEYIFVLVPVIFR